MLDIVMMTDKSVPIVPVFDVTSHYGCMSSKDIPHTLDRFVTLAVRGPRFVGEVPVDSLVGILCVPNKQPHLQHVDMGFNLIGIVVLATPYNTSRA